MRKYPVFVALLWALGSLLLFVGCSDDEGVDNRETEYGYVQFKLYKQASYEAAEASRAVMTQLDYLSEATKVKVTLSYGETTLAQTLNLQSADAESAEYGLRSDKLKLLTGDYEVIAFTLYDASDETIYLGAPSTESRLKVVAGGLTQHDLTVNVAPRGKVRFRFTKDLSEFSQTRAVERQYTFDEVGHVSLTVQNKSTNEQTTFTKLPVEFSTHFNEEDEVEDGHQVSTLACDTLLSLKAGSYRVISYQTFDAGKLLLETKNNPRASEFEVADNRTTEADVALTLYESDAYIQDYYALYEIWKSLNGEKWYYVGENYVRGANWDFNKDIDLWGDQPGVALHSNGRVARLDLSDFGFSGHLSPAIGQLTEMVELYLGTHNDVNSIYDPTLALDQSLSERSRNRMENHKRYLASIHPAVPLSEPCARALAEHNISTPATVLYNDYSEAQLIDKKSGGALQIRPMDTNHGTICNGLKSLPEEIASLQKLEYLYIANSELESLPESLSELKSCTDLEIYNCPKLTEFPMVITRMPELISLNISNNAQWSAEEIYRGMEGLATGPSKEKIQILYARQNQLEELPEAFRNMKKMGLLDLAYNRISKIHPLGREVAPVQLYLDNNLLESLPRDEEGYFCGYDDVETFSVNYNKLKKVPNIFSAKSTYTMTSVSFAGNEIDGFEVDPATGKYNGIKVETFTLSQNPRLTKYPLALAESNSEVSYLILRACSIDEIPKGSFTYDNADYLTSLDLSYNRLTDLPWEFHAGNMPYFYGLDISFNSFSEFPYEPLDCSGLTVFAIRSQRDEQGARCLREWPTGIYNHRGMRGLYIGSNDLRTINDTISTLIYYLDISDNPNIIFDASDICYAWYVGAYILIYDKTQTILNCEYMLE